MCACCAPLVGKSRLNPSNECVEKCAEGNYGKTGKKDGTYGTCEPCPAECKSCVSADECLSCIDGSVLSCHVLALLLSLCVSQVKAFCLRFCTEAISSPGQIALAPVSAKPASSKMRKASARALSTVHGEHSFSCPTTGRRDSYTEVRNVLMVAPCA